MEELCHWLLAVWAEPAVTNSNPGILMLVAGKEMVSVSCLNFDSVCLVGEQSLRVRMMVGKGAEASMVPSGFHTSGWLWSSQVPMQLVGGAAVGLVGMETDPGQVLSMRLPIPPIF